MNTYPVHLEVHPKLPLGVKTSRQDLGSGCAMLVDPMLILAGDYLAQDLGDPRVGTVDSGWMFSGDPDGFTRLRVQKLRYLGPSKKWMDFKKRGEHIRTKTDNTRLEERNWH